MKTNKSPKAEVKSTHVQHLGSEYEVCFNAGLTEVLPCGLATAYEEYQVTSKEFGDLVEIAKAALFLGDHIVVVHVPNSEANHCRCGVTLPTVPDTETPFEFCSEHCAWESQHGVTPTKPPKSLEQLHAEETPS